MNKKITNKERYGACYPKGHCEHIPKYTDADRKRIAHAQKMLVGPYYKIAHAHECCKCKMVCSFVHESEIIAQLCRELGLKPLVQHE